MEKHKPCGCLWNIQSNSTRYCHLHGEIWARQSAEIENQAARIATLRTQLVEAIERSDHWQLKCTEAREQLAEANERIDSLVNEAADAARLHGLVCDDLACKKECHDCLRDQLAEATARAEKAEAERDDLIKQRAISGASFAALRTQFNAFVALANGTPMESLCKDSGGFAFQDPEAVAKGVEIFNEAITTADRLEAENARLREAAIRKDCEWVYDECDDMFVTECGESWTFADGGYDGPEYNKAHYCYHCGGNLVRAALENPND